MKNAVLTGVTGSIGHALVDELLERGYHCYLLCRPDSPRNASIKKDDRIHIVIADLSELHTDRVREELPSSCTAFFHLGWISPFGPERNNMVVQTKNIEYTIDAVHLARDLGCKVFVGAGSQAEYGRVEGDLSDKTPTFPENGYGMAKLCAGAMSRVECEKYGIKHIWGRILSVYGPYDANYTLISTAIIKLLRNEETAFTEGEQLWDYLYSKDAAWIFAELALGNGQDGGVYCLGSGTQRRLKDYLNVIKDMIDPEAEMGLGKLPYNDKQVMFLRADTENLEKHIGFKPRYSFEEGIAETIAWMKENQAK